MNLNVTKNAMRGLTVFISDLRNAQSKESEEKRVTKEMAHIRKEFKENKGIDGYQRRKYVCKLLYIYMLGYDLDFGHMEAVTLISSNKFQEKLIGYIALGMLLHENHEMIPLLINSLQEDLQARSDFFQCLALSSIANIGGKEMAESLAPIVQKLLVANTSPPHIKKRAALALLRLYRKYPSLITPDMWAEKLVACLDDPDLGTLTSVMSLFLGFVANNPIGWEVIVPKVVGLLGKIVITREYTKDYVYYSIPNPWLQTKLLRFLRYFSPPSEPAVSGRLTEILNVIFASADAAKAGTVNHKNALNAVLFEAINLVIHQDNDHNLLRQTGALLGRFISAKETNIRYLGLEAMSHLASLSTETANMVKKYQETVILSLKDADISIRRRALDLLYGMCDKNSSKTIVAELLNYLVSADYAIREELVLKIANLAEKFASNYSWYVDVVLQLIGLAGDFVSDDIWHRVIKIVTNHEDIQEYAARTVFKALQSPTCHETTVKVGGYILGEFGHLIAEQKDSGPQAQFQVLHNKFPTCSLTTRALLLTTYAKFVNLYPELARTVQEVFNSYRSFIDLEVQQRACEYFNLTTLNDEELLQTVLDVIPAWNEKEEGSAANEGGQLIQTDVVEGKARARWQGTESPVPSSMTGTGSSADTGKDLLGLEFSISAGTGAGNSHLVTPSSNGRALPSSDPTDPFGLHLVAGASTNPSISGIPSPISVGTSIGMSVGTSATTGAGSAAGGLLDVFGVGTGPSTSLTNVSPTSVVSATIAGNGASDIFGGSGASGSSLPSLSPTPNPFIPGSTSPTAATSSSPTPIAMAVGHVGIGSTLDGSGGDSLQAKISAAFRRLCLASEGILYEDGMLQVGMKSEYQRHMGRIMFYYGNGSMSPLSNFQAAFVPVASVQFQPQPVVNIINPKAQAQQLVTLVCNGDKLDDQPTLQISFVISNKPVNLILRLPVVVTKFIEPLKLSAPDFFSHWKNYGGKPFEAQDIFKAGKPIDLNWMSKVLGDGCRTAVLKGVDPSINNLVASGTFYSSAGQAMCLIRLETNPQANMCRLTIRSASGPLTNALMSVLTSVLSSS